MHLELCLCWCVVCACTTCTMPIELSVYLWGFACKHTAFRCDALQHACLAPGVRCDYVFPLIHVGKLLWESWRNTGDGRAAHELRVPVNRHFLLWAVAQAVVPHTPLCLCQWLWHSLPRVSSPHVAVSLVSVPPSWARTACCRWGRCSVVSLADRPVPVSCAEYLYCVLHAGVHADVATHASLGNSCSECTGGFPCSSFAEYHCIQLVRV
jgi:hypothetical protein